MVEERSRREELEWVRKLRSELAQSQTGFTRSQRALLETALGSLETRMSTRVEETARAYVEAGSQIILSRAAKDFVAKLFEGMPDATLPRTGFSRPATSSRMSGRR